MMRCPRCGDEAPLEESAFVSGYTCGACELELEREHLATTPASDCFNPWCRHHTEAAGKR